MTPRRWLVPLATTLATLAAIAAVAVALQRGSTRDDGPRPIAWGEEACAHCRMHISDPRYAAQLLTLSGEASSFDDPGCLLLRLGELEEPPVAVYFHHARDDRWLRAPAVAFVRAGPTPMGFDLVAVEPGAAGALDLSEATRLARARSAPRAGEAVPHEPTDPLHNARRDPVHEMPSHAAPGPGPGAPP